MSTAQVPAIDMNKLNSFIGQFVTDLGAAVHSVMVVIGETGNGEGMVCKSRLLSRDVTFQKQ